MNKVKQMWIPCTEAEYPEVKMLLGRIGFKVFPHLEEWTRECIGVITYYDGYLQATVLECVERTTVSLPELREMVKQKTPSFGEFVSKQLDGSYYPELLGGKTDDREELRLLIQRVGIMERSIMGIESKINEIHDLLFNE